MAVLDSLILSVHTNTVHLHFVSPDTHLELFHTLMIHHTQLILSLPSTHTQSWSRLHTQDRGVYVVLKTLMRRFLSAKSQVFRESGVSLKVLTLLRCLPKAAGLDQRERNGGYDAGGGQRGGVVGGAYFSRSGDLNIWSLLYWVWVTCTADLHFIPPFSKVASHNCGGREKSERNQCLHQYKQVLLLQLLLLVKLILD